MSKHARRSRRWTGLVLSMALLAVVPQASSAGGRRQGRGRL